jgi:hypothetical protein
MQEYREIPTSWDTVIGGALLTVGYAAVYGVLLLLVWRILEWVDTVNKFMQSH